MIFGAGFLKSRSAGSRRGILYSRTNICFKVPLGIFRKSSSIIFSTIAPEFSRLKCIISFLLYFWAKNRLIDLFTYLFAAAASLFFLVCSRDGRGVANKAAPYKEGSGFDSRNMAFTISSVHQSAYLYFKLKICWAVGEVKVCRMDGWMDGAEITKSHTFFNARLTIIVTL